MGEYRPEEIEPKWQRFWQEQECYKVGTPGPKKFYCLDMFPYPSGSGLHLGHPVGYTATDMICRYKRMQGYSVLHPMGWDAFGLPAEQHAVATGEHPSLITEANCERFKSQMHKLGLSFDWSREVFTCRADYYHWTQWIFLKLYNSWFDDQAQRSRPIEELPIPAEVTAKGERAIEEYRAGYRLAYYADAMVNWCPALGTVLANEEVIDGKSERGGHDVIRKPMKQWMLRITKYAERLLSELEGIDWPESIKEQQRNWIGKKFGAEIQFAVHGSKETLTAFTTRPDTLFGVTFFVLSPEHSLVSAITTEEQREKVDAYVAQAKKLSDMARTMENRKKTGVPTGGFVINPINGEQVPVYVGDYVLMGVGTGAVMGVPAHDERDFEFARTFNIPIRTVIAPQGASDEVVEAVIEGEMAWTESGVMLANEYPVSAELKLSGLANQEAGDRICGWLEQKGLGRKVVSYKLRDWLFSRQRYWGEPIPIVHWEDGRITALKESELPLVLPQVVDYKPSDDGESPLAKAGAWLEVTDPATGSRGRRETNTMPQWAGSCWYYLRFIDPKNAAKPWDTELEKAWMPVDLYVGGAEHAVLHLLYSRFWHKVLFDLGYVSTREPFQKLVNQGMLLAYAYKDKRGALIPVDKVREEEGGAPVMIETGEVLERIVAKMSKSLRNVVTPDEIIEEYGADTLRLYIMFMGPIDCSRIYDAKAIMGVHRFLKRAWNLVTDGRESGIRDTVADDGVSKEVQQQLHQLIKRAGEDLEAMRFNTGISAMMEFVNNVYGQPVSKRVLEQFTLVLAPFAPHLAEEMWARLGHSGSITAERWPSYDPALLERNKVTVVIQVNGKKRSTVDVDVGITEDALRGEVIRAMSATSFPVREQDRFITVFQSGGKIPKLVNVIAAAG